MATILTLHQLRRKRPEPDYFIARMPPVWACFALSIFLIVALCWVLPYVVGL